MSLKPSPIEPVPEETACIAKAAFRRGNPYLVRLAKTGGEPR